MLIINDYRFRPHVHAVPNLLKAVRYAATRVCTRACSCEYRCGTDRAAVVVRGHQRSTNVGAMNLSGISLGFAGFGLFDFLLFAMVEARYALAHSQSDRRCDGGLVRLCLSYD